MQVTDVLFGQVLAVFGIVIAGVWGAGVRVDGLGATVDLPRGHAGVGAVAGVQPIALGALGLGRSQHRRLLAGLRGALAASTGGGQFGRERRTRCAGRIGINHKT